MMKLSEVIVCVAPVSLISLNRGVQAMTIGYEDGSGASDETKKNAGSLLRCFGTNL